MVQVFDREEADVRVGSHFSDISNVRYYDGSSQVRPYESDWDKTTVTMARYGMTTPAKAYFVSLHELGHAIVGMYHSECQGSQVMDIGGWMFTGISGPSPEDVRTAKLIYNMPEGSLMDHYLWD